ncbi:MAG: primosomal protein N' [Spartobacteria bacterium AMD-G5]|nr:MAG: primosomal protein N' [Spartobacteria bacterium AMD-G5]
MFVRVLPDQAAGKILDYRVPEAMSSKIAVGSRVKIPVRTRLLTGTVIELLDACEFSSVRDITDLLDERPMIRPALLELAYWMADYYCCPLETAVCSVLPVAVRDGRVTTKKQNTVCLAREFTESELEKIAVRAPRQADALRVLIDAGKPLAVTKAANLSGVSEAVFRTLEKHGFVAIEASVVARNPHAEQYVSGAELTLNTEQEEAMKVVVEEMTNPSRPILLFGVTGSGKTEIYLRAIRHSLDAGKTALVLVPEIALTPQTVERFKSRFADIQDRIAVLHSHLSEGERHDEWHKIHTGHARVVIGARSSIFAPVENPGVIIIDEEHESSYKQDEAPRYNARDMAVLRASREKAAVILGSATPSLESWHNAQSGKYRLVRLNQRVDDKSMPVVRVVDLRRPARNDPGGGILSKPLREAIEGRIQKGEQTILFLNRRGFSTSMICEACGHVCECNNCSVSLTYHRAAERLVCHICGHNQRAPKSCPKCSDPRIRHAGTGTQKVEEALQRIFPKARIARMDADSMTRKEAYRETLGAFKEGRIDILVGTQMIAKGLHFPNVTLVGIVNADLGLHIPDFRAGERTFQLLTQVAGRAGRGEMEGEVYVQTFTPFSPSIQFARHHDFEGFMEQEMEFRRSFGYPPFGKMAMITLRGTMLERVEFSAITLSRKLKAAAPEGILVGEGVPAPLEKAKTYYRFQVSLRGSSSVRLARLARGVLDALPMPEDVFVAVDIDPLHLM